MIEVSVDRRPGRHLDRAGEPQPIGPVPQWCHLIDQRTGSRPFIRRDEEEPVTIA